MRSNVVSLSVLLIFATLLLQSYLPIGIITCSYIIVTCMLLLGFILPPQNAHHAVLARQSQAFQDARLQRQEREYSQAQKTRMIKEKYLGVPDE